MRNRIRLAAATAVTLGAVAVCDASAQPPNFPAKPIRVIVSSAPGTAPDIVARIVGEKLDKAFAQPIIVENRPGGSGTIALASVAKADPDGYTLGTISPPATAAPSLLPQLPFDIARDLAPVCQITWGSAVVVVRGESRFRSLGDLIAAAKAQPGGVTYGSGGNGTPGHLATELFKLRAGVDLRHIPYKGGAAAVTGLLGEQVDLVITVPVSAAALLKSGKLRALATTGPSREPALPEVQTLAELGFTGFDVRDWQGLVAPAATPKPVIERIAAEISKISKQADVRARLAALGIEPVADSSPAAFGKLIDSEITRWGKVVREAGIRAD